MDERFPEVNRLAAVILSQPAVTARDLARAVGFSQHRSVYYWLRKAGYNGLTSFRNAVLTGEYPVAAYPRGQFKPRSSHVAEVPLSPTENPRVGATNYVVTTLAVGQGAFALTVTSDEYVPLFEQSDIVIIDPEAPVADGDLVVVKDSHFNDVLCRTYPGRNPLYVHPATGRPLQVTAAQPKDTLLIGKIVGMQRSF